MSALYHVAAARIRPGSGSGLGLRRIVAAALVLGGVLDAPANPKGMAVANGNASSTLNGARLDVSASANAFLNWQSFNIAPGETTAFHQPSAASIVWNRINDPNPSQIWGHLNANGIVVLMNQSGFFFGPGSVVNAAGFVATTATTLPDLSAGGMWQFNGPPPLASIVNYGEIKVNSGGSAFLIAEKIENHGVLMAPDGTLGLYAGKEVLMSARPDGRGLSVAVRLPAGSVDNQGKLIADGGSIALHAQTVNQDGLIQANSVLQRHGTIELIASDSINLGSHSDLAARGEGSTLSSGGEIIIRSAGSFSDAAGSRISVAGGALGGNGGKVELSAPLMSAIHSLVDGSAVAGWVGGSLVIDPTDIIIANAGGTAAVSGAVNANDPPGTLQLDVNSSFVGLANITLQATHNLTVQGDTTWDLNQSTGISAPGSLLTLQAGNDLIFENNAALKAGPGWSVALWAGASFTSPNTVQPGVGSILFQGNGSIEASDGSISLHAGMDVTVNSGFVRTVGGGSIDVNAASGSVNTGTRVNGFKFQSGLTGYRVDPDLGGISTAAGGNVSLTAGQDITSYLPTGNAATDGGSGAFGVARGDVTLNAGGNVSGHYVVRAGTGTINAGVRVQDGTVTVSNPGANAGTPSRSLALSLVTGGWTVNAAHDILLQEVRNPNGVFNSLGFSSSFTKHSFDYAPDAYVILNAGNSVELLGGALPRNSGSFEQGIPSIYPSTLDITAGPGTGLRWAQSPSSSATADIVAGSGDVILANNVTLFPSPVGQLDITTTGGGSLIGTKPGDLANLVMSDSSATHYTSGASFGASEHAPTPLHLRDPIPVNLSISGDLVGVLLVSPKSADINVRGNVVNSRFNVQNLHPTDVTTLNVAGDILNRNEFTSTPLAQAPDLTVFDHPYNLPSTLAGLSGKLSYNAPTHTLTFQGRMTSEELQTLLSLSVVKLDALGNPILDAQGNPVVETVAVLPTATALALFNGSQDVPLSPNTGYLVGGPGTVNITAHNLDLGATLGIQSVGPANNPALAPLGSSGAAINVNLTGDLDMFSTTISSLAGGDIHIKALGSVNVGATDFTGNDTLARGIFTVGKSDVSVIANGDINVNGSRIAAYDGGNVTVISLAGNVDAGKGGNGSVSVEKVIVDPVTGEVKTYTPTIPGSGILATTFPPSLDAGFPNSPNPVGNIDVETPQGNIIASSGGIVQVALNGVNSRSATVTLVAGSKDAQGNVLYKGSIDASGSGIIGGNVNLDATDGIKGLIVAQQNITISAQQNVNVTAIGAGNVSVSAGGTISGTIVGVGSVSASGSSIDASLLSQNVSASGNLGSAQVGFSQANAAGSTSQSAASETDEQTKKATTSNTNDDEEKKKKQLAAGAIRLVRSIGRVTVILSN